MQDYRNSDMLFAFNAKLLSSDLHTRLGNEVAEIRRMLTGFMATSR